MRAAAEEDGGFVVPKDHWEELKSWLGSVPSIITGDRVKIPIRNEDGSPLMIEDEAAARGITIGVDFGRQDVTSFAVYAPKSYREDRLAPIRSGDVAQMIADIDRVEVTKRSHMDRFHEMVAEMERDIARGFQDAVNLMIFYY